MKITFPLMVLFLLLNSPFTFAGEIVAALENSPNALESLLNTEVTTVTGASKYQQELVDAPASISIITRDDIRNSGYRNLAEALNRVRGFYTTYDRSYHYVGLRGFSPLGDYNTRILLLVDGYRLNDAVYEQAPLGSDFPVDMDLIERIEVIRGPGSSLYGTNAFLAVINVITRDGNSLSGGEISASGGSFNAWTGRVSGGSKFDNGADFMISGSYRDIAGIQKLWFPEYAATNGGISRGMDGENSWDLLAKGSWKDFSMLVLHQTRDKDNPTASYGTTSNDPSAKISDRHTLAGINYNHHAGFADINARLTYNHYEFDGDYPRLDELTQIRTVNRDTTLADWIGSDIFLVKSLGSHQLTGGMEHRWQFSQQQRNFDVLPQYNSYLDSNRRLFVQGYYLQDEYHILDNLILNAGLRWDHYDNFGSTVNPRAALIWKPSLTTVLRLSYGEAFRAPNAYELYYGDQISSRGNPDLKPEKIRTVELGVDQYIGENYKAGINGFYTRISDLIEQVTDANGLLVYENQSQVEAKGAELYAEGRWENGFISRINYTYQDVRNTNSARFVTNSPRHIAKASLTAPLPLRKSFATLEGVYNSARLNSLGERIAGGVIFNLTLLSRDIIENLDLSASVYNLFDSRYSHPAGSEQYNSRGEALREIAQDGISFRVKATWRF